jgi:hypothetical protein
LPRNPHERACGSGATHVRHLRHRPKWGHQSWAAPQVRLTPAHCLAMAGPGNPFAPEPHNSGVAADPAVLQNRWAHAHSGITGGLSDTTNWATALQGGAGPGPAVGLGAVKPWPNVAHAAWG